MDQGQKQDMKELMPRTTLWVAGKRKEWGDAHVTAMLRRAMKGERNCCWLVERTSDGLYRTFGEPFDGWGAEELRLIGECFTLGTDLLAFMASPKERVDGQPH